MRCSAPFYLYRGVKNENGKRPLQALPVFRDRRIGDEYLIPCGKCLACVLNRARDWALRCVHEASLYKDNIFITLTYDDEHIPPNNSLCRLDFTLFMKRLRRRIEPYKVRYFACGEYGSKTLRPHYHLILFGYDFVDTVIHSYHRPVGHFSSNQRNYLYTSKFLSSIWTYGFSSIGEVSFNSAGYVARYSLKKWRDKPDYFYDCREPEFQTASNRPGIGYEFYQRYKKSIFEKPYISHAGKKYTIPRYYQKLFVNEYPEKAYQRVVLMRQYKISQHVNMYNGDRFSDYIVFGDSKSSDSVLKARTKNVLRDL